MDKAEAALSMDKPSIASRHQLSVANLTSLARAKAKANTANQVHEQGNYSQAITQTASGQPVPSTTCANMAWSKTVERLRRYRMTECLSTEG